MLHHKLGEKDNYREESLINDRSVIVQKYLFYSSNDSDYTPTESVVNALQNDANPV